MSIIEKNYEFVLRKESIVMELETRPSLSRTRKYRKKRKSFPVLLFSIPVLLALGILSLLFLYGTTTGTSIRQMLGGSILSSQHPQYAKFLLTQDEIDKLNEIIYEPPSVTSTTHGFVNHKRASNEPLVRVETVENSNYTAKVMLVSDPTTVHLVSSKYSDKGQALSELIEQNKGIGGINAGGFSDANGTGSGGEVVGIAIGDGKIQSEASFSRIESRLVGGFTSAGQFITGSYSINKLQSLDVTQAVSFGPQLVVDGKDVVTKNIENAYGWAPRTAIGQKDDGTVVMIITDGRFYHNKTHRGASMKDLVQIFQQYQVTQAIALDGGGSTTMIFNGQLQLQPATQTKAGMRYLPNAFIVIPKK
ncbi:MAG TPA: phosphodiester glycosidase family protein [Bacillota bacterium]|nr:phosphodiester glycosidase family protein [Bacillota bacterium]